MFFSDRDKRFVQPFKFVGTTKTVFVPIFLQRISMNRRNVVLSLAVVAMSFAVATSVKADHSHAPRAVAAHVEFTGQPGDTPLQVFFVKPTTLVKSNQPPSYYKNQFGAKYVSPSKPAVFLVPGGDVVAFVVPNPKRKNAKWVFGPLQQVRTTVGRTTYNYFTVEAPTGPANPTIIQDEAPQPVVAQ